MQKEKVILYGGVAAGVGVLALAWNKVSQLWGHKKLAALAPPKVALNPVTHTVGNIAALNSLKPGGTLGSGPSMGAPRVSNPPAPGMTPIQGGGYTVPEVTIYGTPDTGALASAAPGGSPPATVTTVRDVQRALNYLGVANPPLVEDNVAGPLTQAAVKKYQAANPPLVVDGKAGPLTKASLYAAVKAA